MNNREALNRIELSVNEFCLHFINRVFCDEEQTLYDVEKWRVGGEIGGVLLVNDYFFGLEQMIQFERYGYTPDEVFEYMDYYLYSEEREVTRNICNYREMMRKHGAIVNI